MKRRDQQGYALIFIFALSAAMALMLYMEMPRMALELQRNREGLLIERGEQYIRAIKVFQSTNKRFPQTIEELESTNGRRFLRRRYLDPISGKDDWRLIHGDGSGRLTDSLVQKPTVPGQTEEKTASTAGENPQFGSTGDAGQRVAAALNRRASEMPGAPGSAPVPGQPGQPGDPTDPQQQQQQISPGAGLPPNAPPPQQITGPNGQPIARIPGLPGQMGAYPSQPANSQTGGVVPQPAQQQPTYGSGYTFGSGYSGSTAPPPAPAPNQQNQPPMPPGQPQAQFPGQQAFQPIPGGTSQSFGNPAMPGGVTPAAAMIQRMLTTPKPQGMRNLQQAGTQAMGVGIVGVASKVDAEGIKIYKDRTNYKEWEFVFDPAKQRGAPGQIPGQVPGMVNGQVPGQLPTPFGNTIPTNAAPGSPGFSPQPPGPGGMGPQQFPIPVRR